MSRDSPFNYNYNKFEVGKSSPILGSSAVFLLIKRENLKYVKIMIGSTTHAVYVCLLYNADVRNKFIIYLFCTRQSIINKYCSSYVYWGVWAWRAACSCCCSSCVYWEGWAGMAACSCCCSSCLSFSSASASRLCSSAILHSKCYSHMTAV